LTFAASAPASAFYAALSLAALAADKKADTPVRMIADRDTIMFCVTDPRAAISITTTTAASIAEAGEATTSATRLAKLLPGFTPRSVISMAAAERALAISCGEARYRLPLRPEPPGALVIDPEIGRADLATADCLKLLEVVAAADTEKIRFYLNGTYLHSNTGRLIAVSTDGTKMLSTSIAADHFSTDDRCIVPMATITALNKLLRQVKPERVLLRRSRAVFSASAPGFQITTALVDAAFPDYRAVMPQATGSSASCQRAELLAALSRLAAVAGSNAALAALEWADGGPLHVYLARQPEAGADVIAAQTHGQVRKAFALPQLVALIDQFSNEALLLEPADRGLILRQGDKFGVLMECQFPAQQQETAALSA
jgi:DNA polymerase-3 subunit beta